MKSLTNGTKRGGGEGPSPPLCTSMLVPFSLVLPPKKRMYVAWGQREWKIILESLIPNFLKEDIFLFLPFPQKLLEIQKNFPTFSCLTDPFFPAIVFVSRFLVRIPFQTIQQHFLTKQDSKIRRTSEKEAFSERERRKVPCAGAESGGGK